MKKQAASNEELTATNNELALVNQQLREARHKIEESEVALRLAISAANFGTWFIHSVTRNFYHRCPFKRNYSVIIRMRICLSNRHLRR
jgi:hypothetical protein